MLDRLPLRRHLLLRGDLRLQEGVRGKGDTVMRNYSNILVVMGSLCLMITLVLAWCLAGVRASAFMKAIFPNYQYLLKAHLDYLFMAGLLLIFFLLFGHFHLSPSPLVLVAMSIGSFMNPVGFLALAVRPTLRQHPTSPFGLVMLCSFTMTTVGYGGAAWYVGHAALYALM